MLHYFRALDVSRREFPLPSPGSVCGPAAAEEETKDNEGQVKFLNIFV